MALTARLLGRGILSCHGLRPVSLTQCRAVTIQPRPYQAPIEEGHDEKNMKLCRPLSPHLTIYKFQLPANLSISHRFTGIILTGYAAAFAATSLLSHKPMGEIINNISHCYPNFFLFFKAGMIFPFAYHFFNGIRHLVWDTGKALSIKGVYISGYLMLLTAIVSFGGILYYGEETKRIEKELEMKRKAEEEAAAAAAKAAAEEEAKGKKKKKKKK